MFERTAKWMPLVLVVRANYAAARAAAQAAVVSHLSRSADVDDEDALADLDAVQTAAREARTQLDATDPDAAAWIAETFPRRAA